LVRELQAAIGPRWVLHAPEDLIVYEYDATIERGMPEAVVLPDSGEGVAAAVRIARKFGAPVTARGSGTGLSGGAIPCRASQPLLRARSLQPESLHHRRQRR
jgi:glycolate oxidase